jgi:hypothetical protein
MKKKKIKLGQNFSSFLIPQTDVVFPGLYEEGDMVKFMDQNCWIAKVNWITYKVVIVANHTKFIEYETEDLSWLW